MNEAKRRYQQITGLVPATIRPIYGGLNSTNYLIDGKFVLRIKTPSFDQRYDPRQEQLAERLVIASGLVPKLLHFDPTNGSKLTAFIPDTHFISIPPTPSEVRLVAQKLRILHEIEPRGLAPFAALERFANYASAAGMRALSPIEDKILQRIKKLEQNEPGVFAHNDLVRGNLLFCDDTLFIIDYEYAGCNNRLFDLASFITENNIVDRQLIEVFLAEYYQEKNIPRADFAVYCRFLDYLWYYWAQGMFKLTGAAIYMTIARLKGARIAKH